MSPRCHVFTVLVSCPGPHAGNISIMPAPIWIKALPSCNHNCPTDSQEPNTCFTAALPTSEYYSDARQSLDFSFLFSNFRVCDFDSQDWFLCFSLPHHETIALLCNILLKCQPSSVAQPKRPKNAAVKIVQHCTTPVLFHVVLRPFLHGLEEPGHALPRDCGHPDRPQVVVELVENQAQAAAQVGGVRAVVLDRCLERLEVMHPLHSKMGLEGRNFAYLQNLETVSGIESEIRGRACRHVHCFHRGLIKKIEAAACKALEVVHPLQNITEEQSQKSPKNVRVDC
jgi:hypothetical protein